ncbi:hypothetical protein ACIA6C_18130 [Streptomyces sp. NPDC051578]|uniref:hypothetical protein n=1 Tax=unclassified Streptomyces TaxID=2593676 RepID=UPI0033E69885
MTDMRCTFCGAGDLEPGFAEDAGQSAPGYTRWIAGPLERGLFGGAKLMGRPRRQIDAWRCRTCGHLELFATNPC